jgi:hypothetical protein
MFKTALLLITLYTLTPATANMPYSVSFSTFNSVKFGNVNITDRPYYLFIDLSVYNETWLNNVSGYIIYPPEFKSYYTEMNLPAYILCNKNEYMNEFVCDIKSKTISKAYYFNDNIYGQRLIIDLQNNNVIDTIVDIITAKMALIMSGIIFLYLIVMHT